MSLQFQTERVLIWGKTYPELSNLYGETVCTAAVRGDGTPVRLYPVPLRYLKTGYKLYDWIEAPICKSAKDSRPESFKIEAEKIRKVGEIPTDQSGWAGRSELMFKNKSWQFGNVGELKEAQRSTGRSLGVVTPGSIEKIYADYKKPDERDKHEQKAAAIHGQTMLFQEEYKELAFRPFDIKIKWRCDPKCSECINNPHDMTVLDWGLLELARRAEWNPADAISRMEEISGPDHDFRLFLGNLKRHRTSFLPVGMWYPKKRLQQNLL